MLVKHSKYITVSIGITSLLCSFFCSAAIASDSTDALTRPIFTTSSGSNTVVLNESTRLTLSGEAGAGVATYSTMTPAICSVSADGVVTGLIGGTCSILASISGSNNFLVTTPAVIVLNIEEPLSLNSRAVIKQAPIKPAMSVTRENGAFVVNLKFNPENKFKKVLLQIGIRNSMGKINYKGVSSLLLDEQGTATVTKRATYAKSIYFRALIKKKVIVTKKVI